MCPHTRVNVSRAKKKQTAQFGISPKDFSLLLSLSFFYLRVGVFVSSFITSVSSPVSSRLASWAIGFGFGFINRSNVLSCSSYFLIHFSKAIHDPALWLWSDAPSILSSSLLALYTFFLIYRRSLNFGRQRGE